MGDCVCVCVCVHAYVCTYVCRYLYMYTHTLTYTKHMQEINLYFYFSIPCETASCNEPIFHPHNNEWINEHCGLAEL